jgi:hypothetical protein
LTVLAQKLFTIFIVEIMEIKYNFKIINREPTKTTDKMLNKSDK